MRYAATTIMLAVVGCVTNASPGDTLRGEWSETSFIGPVARGRFLLLRR